MPEVMPTKKVVIEFPAETWMAGHTMEVTEQFYEDMIKPWEGVMETIFDGLRKEIKLEGGQ